MKPIEQVLQKNPEAEKKTPEMIFGTLFTDIMDRVTKNNNKNLEYVDKNQEGKYERITIKTKIDNGQPVISVYKKADGDVRGSTFEIAYNKDGSFTVTTRDAVLLNPISSIKKDLKSGFESRRKEIIVKPYETSSFLDTIQGRVK